MGATDERSAVEVVASSVVCGYLDPTDPTAAQLDQIVWSIVAVMPDVDGQRKLDVAIPLVMEILESGEWRQYEDEIRARIVGPDYDYDYFAPGRWPR